MVALPDFQSDMPDLDPDSPPFYVQHIVRRLFSSVNWRHTLRPSVLFAWGDDNDTNTRSRRASTAWLDGLRGFAALQVFLNHFGGLHMDLDATWGSTPEATYIFQHPLLRPIFSAGNSAVCVFFVISGYVLTTRYFVLIRERSFEELYRSLCSSFFRRPLRLYLPVLLTSIPLVFVFQYGWFPGWYQPARKESLRAEITYFFEAADVWLNPFPYITKEGIDFQFTYLPQAWTIPLEWYCSMITFVMVIIVSQMPSWHLRCVVLGFTAFYAKHQGPWWVSNFMLGMMIADWNVEQKTKAIVLPCKRLDSSGQILNTADKDEKYDSIQRWYTAAFIALFCAGYYLSGIPPQLWPTDPPVYRLGYEFLYKLYPPMSFFKVSWNQRLPHTASSVFMVVGISQVPWLQSVFEGKFCSWLGKLSFALYLVHAPAIWVCTGPARLTYAKIMMTDEESSLRYLFELFWVAPVAFMGAAFVEKYFDRPSIQFARWVELQFYGPRTPQTHRPSIRLPSIIRD